MGEGIERARVEREGIRKFAEVCGSSMEVHERAPRVRKYTLLLSRGSSYGRQIVVAGRAFGNFGRAEHRAHPGIPSRPECRRANERERARSRKLLEIGGSRHKNFNLDIFRINESRGTRVRHEPTYSLHEPGLSYTCIIILLLLDFCVPMLIIRYRGFEFKRVAMGF